MSDLTPTNLARELQTRYSLKHKRRMEVLKPSPTRMNSADTLPWIYTKKLPSSEYKSSKP